MLNNVFKCSTEPFFTTIIEADCFKVCPIARLTRTMFVRRPESWWKVGWLGGSVGRALARDRKVASSNPGQSATE